MIQRFCWESQSPRFYFVREFIYLIKSSEPPKFLPISSTPQPERRQPPQRRHSIEKETPTNVRQFLPPSRQSSRSLVSTKGWAGMCLGRQQACLQRTGRRAPQVSCTVTSLCSISKGWALATLAQPLVYFMHSFSKALSVSYY